MDISVLSCVLLYIVLLLLVDVSLYSCKNSLGRKFLQNQNKFEFVLSWCFRAKIQTLFQNWFFRWRKLFFDMLNMIEPSKFLVARDGFFVNGRSSWMLLSFKFLIACTVALSYSLVKKICLLFQLEWCSQVLFSGVLSGEILPICDGHQIKLNRL